MCTEDCISKRKAWNKKEFLKKKSNIWKSKKK